MLGQTSNRRAEQFLGLSMNVKPESTNAKRLGHAWYVTDKECPKGHVMPRRTVRRGECLECERDKAVIRKPPKGTRNKWLGKECGCGRAVVAKGMCASHYSTDQVRRRKLRAASREPPQECEICGKECLVVFDHCHVTGVFRGWLCSTCNSGIGMLRDSSSIAYKAASYLKRFEELSAPAPVLTLSWGVDNERRDRWHGHGVRPNLEKVDGK